MSRKTVAVFLSTAALICPRPIFAHANHGGYEISINGEKVSHSSVPELSPNGIMVPSFVGWRVYQPGQQLTFSLDLNDFTIPRENDKFLAWNFGDGSVLKHGASVSHAYTRSGSYILSLVYFEPPATPMPLSINETLIHIGPADFSPPRGQISVNGIVPDSPAEYLPFNIEQELEFKLILDQGITPEIADVLWDFGGGVTIAGNPVRHTYQRGPDGNRLDLVQAVVKYSTLNGYTNFQWLGLKNYPPTPTPPPPSVPRHPTILLSLAVVPPLALMTVFLLVKYLKHRQ